MTHNSHFLFALVFVPFSGLLARVEREACQTAQRRDGDFKGGTVDEGEAEGLPAYLSELGAF